MENNCREKDCNGKCEECVTKLAAPVYQEHKRNTSDDFVQTMYQALLAERKELGGAPIDCRKESDISYNNATINTFPPAPVMDYKRGYEQQIRDKVLVVEENAELRKINSELKAQVADSDKVILLMAKKLYGLM